MVVSLASDFAVEETGLRETCCAYCHDDMSYTTIAAAVAESYVLKRFIIRLPQRSRKWESDNNSKETVNNKIHSSDGRWLTCADDADCSD